jgi:hypothetical protein
MAAEPVHSELEEERAYWQTRIATLEVLLCELLVKNERLRRQIQVTTSAPPDQEVALMDF